MAKTDMNPGEIQKLEERVKKLAADKSYLELIIRLIHKMSTVSGLENTIDSMLQNILDVIGGENLILYYKIDNIVYYSDVFGKKMRIAVITDTLVNEVFEKSKDIEFEHSFSDTKLTTNEFTQAYTWIFPLMVGQETIGVLKMENMMMGKRELSKQLPMFFSYVALVLKNEILGHSRLMQVNEQLNIANEILKKAKEELEIRVADRTFELQQANVQLQAELFERQRVEDALREQYSTLHGIIESTNSVIFSIDTRYRYTSFNSLHAAIMKQIYGVDVLNGQNLLDYMTVAEDRAKAKQNLDRALAGERFIEGAFSGDEGISRRYFEVSHNPVKSTDGSIVGVAVLSRDLTERKMAEEALRASEEKYRTLIQKIQAAVVVHSADTHILTCNPSAELLLGLTADQLMGKEATDPAWHFFRENRTPMPFEEYPVNRVLTTGRALSNFVTGIHRPGNANGTDVWVIVNADPVFGKENEIVQVIVTFTDITERKTAEDALQRSNRELRAISNCNQVLLRALDEQTLLNEICSIVCEEAGYKMAWVGYARNDEVKTISPVAWAGSDSSYISNANLTWAETSANGNGPAGNAIRSGEIVYVQDFTNNPLMLPWRESTLRHGYKSGIALPLRDEYMKVFGAFMIYSSEINAITPDEIRLLEELSGDLAYGIINLRTRGKHKQAEEKLIASEERYKRITSGITDYLYTVKVKNGQAVETIHNDACQLITGYTPQEFIDDPYLWIHMVAPEDRELVGKKFSRIIEGKDFTPIEHRIICKDGKTCWISDTAIPKYNDNGELVSYDGVIKDITERKNAEETLYEGQQVFRILVECSPDIIARYDLDCKRTYVNPVYLKEAQIPKAELISSTPLQISPLPMDSAVALQSLLRRVLSSGIAETIDVIWPKKDNINYWYNIFAFPEFDREGNVVSVMTISRDISVHKRIEEERLAKLRYFESIDAFNKTIQEGTDVEQMMKNVLDSVLRVFDCDRAFLMYPCDPEADFWKVPMESSKPEYPGVLQLGLEIPMDAGVAGSLRILLDSDHPVKFGPGTAYPLPAEISEQFGFKCFMSMAIYPKVGKPWQFGIHQCSYARNWTPDEERLLQEIGWRFADAITNLMVFRDLQQSEKKYHRIVDTANEGIWLLGPDNLTTFVNARMTEIIGYPLEEIVGRPVSDFMFDEDVPDYQNNLLRQHQGLPDTFESRLLHKDGRTIWVNVAATPVSDDTESFNGSFAMLTDITNRKHAESQILKLNRIYSVLSNINQTIVRIHKPEEMLKAACQIAVEYGSFLMAWIGMVDYETNKVVATASHGIIGDYLEKINIDLTDESRSNGPTGVVIKTGRHKISNNIENDESMISWRDNAITYGYKSSAAFPITVYGKIVGAFNIYSGETGFFEEDDIKLLDEMAIDISFALEYIESETLRNLAEAELQKSEERYRLIAENTADTITVFDRHFNITYISPSVFKLRGITVEEAAAQSLDEMLTPGSLKKAIPVFTNDMARETKATEDITRTTLMELEEYCKDGSTIWVEISVSILRDTTLSPVGILTVTRDISQRKQLEFQLRNSEQEFRSLAESSPDIIIRYDLNCRAIYANQRFFKTVPSNPEAFIGKTPIESYPAVMEDYQAKLQKVIETGVPEYLELQLSDVDGNLITHYVCFVAELDNDQKRIGALAIGRDITELRQSEEKVKQLSRAVEQSPVSILITDSKGNIQYLNKKTTEITGYFPDELIGKNPRIFSSGEHTAEKYKALWQTVSSGNEWRGEFHNKKKSGELFWELASISPIKDESGKFTQYLAVKEDITAKKELENNLINAKERAELANKLKDAFIANISHEIRTPLNGIVGMTSIIRELYSKYIKEDEEHYFTSISRSSRRLMISVDKILNFSRLQVGDFPLKLSKVSIAAVLEAVVTEYQKYSQEKSLQLVFNSSAEDDKVFVDETAIETAFTVIVENAIKFTDKGAVTIELYRNEQDNLCVEVRDTGIGISEEYLSHLFEPYTQEVTGYSRPFEGVGLGLSIAKKLFDLNKACVEVSSKKGEGSIFKVCFKYQEELLPKLSSEPQADKPKQTPSPSRPSAKIGSNILVVEDDAINQIFIKSILKKDYQIVLAADADKAFKFFQNQQFDLILMDISLKQGMNGLELTRLIRSGGRNSAVPIIAVTGHAFPTDRQNALESGCTDYLSKPFEPEDLLEKVRLYI